MIAKCPNCKFEYEVESNGKYLCGVCEKKFFFFKDGTTELATAPDADLPAAGGAISSRQFHTGDMILGHYRVIKMIATGTSDVIYRCFDESSCEHVMLKDLFPDIAIADESTARFQKVTELPAPAQAAPAPAPVAPAPAPVAPAPAPAAPVAPAAAFVLCGNGATPDIEINKDEFVIGKSQQRVDGVVRGSNLVSRVHCKAVIRNGECSIVDLNSLNGTFINGNKLTPGAEYRIADGATLSVADVQFVFKKR